MSGVTPADLAGHAFLRGMGERHLAAAPWHADAGMTAWVGRGGGGWPPLGRTLVSGLNIVVDVGWE